MSLRRSLVAGLSFSFFVLSPAVADANGRFPAAGQIVVDPGDPQHLVVRTTYGILQSTDGGASFQWICEAAVGFGGIEDPAMAITQGGALLAGIFAGLSISEDEGCQWAFVGAPLKDEYVIDVAVEQQAPERAVAITSTGSMDGFHVLLAETLDGAKTWQAAGVPIDEEFLALTVEVAPSMPQRVYASGLYGSSYVGAIQRTDDRGQTWTMFPMTLPAGAAPYIGAVDPNDPDRVYVRVDTSPHDILLVSDDGGQSFVEATVGKGDMLGFALSPDGTKVAVGGPDLGVQVASAATLSFTPASTVGVKCLKWHASGLYACADEFTDGFTVGRSMDDGASFEAVYHLPDLGPLECPASTPTGNLCPASWPATKETISGSTGAAVGAGGGAAASSGTGGGDGDGGGCRSAPGSSGGGWLAFAAVLGAVAATGWRRRRR